MRVERQKKNRGRAKSQGKCRTVKRRGGNIRRKVNKRLRNIDHLLMNKSSRPIIIRKTLCMRYIL